MGKGGDIIIIIILSVLFSVFSSLFRLDNLIVAVIQLFCNCFLRFLLSAVNPRRTTTSVSILGPLLIEMHSGKDRFMPFLAMFPLIYLAAFSKKIQGSPVPIQRTKPQRAADAGGERYVLTPLEWAKLERRERGEIMMNKSSSFVVVVGQIWGQSCGRIG